MASGLGKVRDAVRQEIVAGQLAAPLPSLALVEGGCFGVLDTGCGQGRQAIRLARSGYDVTGVDMSQELLDEAKTAASAEPAAVQERLRFEPGNLLDLAEAHLGHLDVECCHGVSHTSRHSIRR